jgi:hypothetical protein
MRLLSRAPARGPYELNWKTQENAPQGLMAHAHRTQPSTD